MDRRLVWLGSFEDHTDVDLTVPAASAITSYLLDEVAQAVKTNISPLCPSPKLAFPKGQDTANFLGLLIGANTPLSSCMRSSRLRCILYLLRTQRVLLDANISTGRCGDQVTKAKELGKSTKARSGSQAAFDGRAAVIPADHL
jgi:hypothetical protein